MAALLFSSSLGHKDLGYLEKLQQSHTIESLGQILKMRPRAHLIF